MYMYVKWPKSLWYMYRYMLETSRVSSALLNKQVDWVLVMRGVLC